MAGVGQEPTSPSFQFTMLALLLIWFGILSFDNHLLYAFSSSFFSFSPLFAFPLSNVNVSLCYKSLLVVALVFHKGNN